MYLDTGWEHPAVREHLEYLRGVLGPIVEVRGPLGLADLVRRKGMFPSRKRRFCTEELKVFPAQAYLRSRVDAGEELVNVVGIRREESRARSTMTEWEWSDGWDCEVWRPILDWRLGDVVDIHRRHGVRPNGLYLIGMTRVGCWPCINSSKGELRRIADLDPARIDEIRALEAEVGVAARARYDARAVRLGEGTASKRDLAAMLDETGNVKPFHPPAYFQAPMPDADGNNPPWPIDRIVEWAQTKRGGREADKQLDLLAIGGINDGCMRWGLCETSQTDVDEATP
jgi:3'-phosphoadenosine 5'-phosphosulfate sulfotransferase (PAPS reductase)/FAD synthetase